MKLGLHQTHHIDYNYETKPVRSISPLRTDRNVVLCLLCCDLSFPLAEKTVDADDEVKGITERYTPNVILNVVTATQIHWLRYY